MEPALSLTGVGGQTLVLIQITESGVRLNLLYLHLMEFLTPMFDDLDLGLSLARAQREALTPFVIRLLDELAKEGIPASYLLDLISDAIHPKSEFGSANPGRDHWTKCVHLLDEATHEARQAERAEQASYTFEAAGEANKRRENERLERMLRNGCKPD